MDILAIVIGNGFDLDLGLPSKYADFIKSKEWDSLFKRVSSFDTEDYTNHSLLWLLHKTSLESNWFDIEEVIHRFVNEHQDLTLKQIEEIHWEFDLLRKSLAEYLRRVSKGFKADESKLACRLTYEFMESPMAIREIYFNYTDPRSFMQYKTFYNPPCFTSYVHGNLDNDEIVLGCDIHEGESVNRQLSFMYKYNMLKQSNHVARYLLEAKEVIFFGHSVNEMDFCYFREFFKTASTAPNPIRHLTIITYDDESERAIKDNIRNQGISVTDLYNNLYTFDIIHTTKVYAGNKEEIKKLNLMVMRVLSKDRQGI